MIAQKKRFNLWQQSPHIFRFVFAPAQTLFSNGAVEAFYVSLLILLVRTSQAVPTAVVPDLESKLGLKLAAAISLHNLHKAIEAASHAAMQKSSAVISIQLCT